ncbi:hypothetical protein OF117_20320 [Geodermatophilus sp. YIM 151500]|uniref:hypothetical protein n=1 Tax=Geodermatophilus sp. YIM 151500 TaxID=2984531 RepID=UPI0021E39C74|nr:hypothetical protein [Geodermatophilus sp. YIM 151500]MCV2491696.1 hypothetical protein [Geodermatophilus sp. YIM 151500]
MTRWEPDGGDGGRSPSGDPWADPATVTEPGPPYTGPPPTAPPPHPYAGWGRPAAALGPPYGPAWEPVPGWPGWTTPRRPAAPSRPGRLVAAAVLAFVQAGLVLLASLYVWFFASLAELAVSGAPGYSSARTTALASEGTVLAAVQLVSVVPLVAGGVLVLQRRARPVRLGRWTVRLGPRAAWRALVAGLGGQVALALYWAVRLVGLAGDGLGGLLLVGAGLFAAAPLVALGLLASGEVRRWSRGGARS